jgi:hypothetical protein
MHIKRINMKDAQRDNLLVLLKELICVKKENLLNSKKRDLKLRKVSNLANN